MVRLFAASAAAVAATALAVGLAAPPTAGPRSSGMAAECRVGRCRTPQVGFSPRSYYVNNYDIINVGAVPCTDRDRRYRVTQHVQHQVDCASGTQNTYITRDLVVLCVVQD